MAKVVYKSYNRNEGSLFPVYLSDMVSAEHPARVVDAVVENIDIRELERTYKGGGTSSYAPRAYATRGRGTGGSSKSITGATPSGPRPKND